MLNSFLSQGLKVSLVLLATMPWAPVLARTVRAKVVGVHDGDTIAVNFIKAANEVENNLPANPSVGKNERINIRMLGIDTPETFYMGQSQGEPALAARDDLRMQLQIDDVVTLDLDTEETDRYGRYLAHVFKGKTHLNKYMAEKGWAVNYVIAPNIKYTNEIADAVKSAQEQGLGIWNPSNPLPELPYNFRHRVAGTGNTRFVGDTVSKKFYQPDYMEKVLVWARIFFPTQKEAKGLGYILERSKPAKTNVETNFTDSEIDTVLLDE